jgi:hypothetical protein
VFSYFFLNSKFWILVMTQDHVLNTEVALVIPADAGPYCGGFFSLFLNYEFWNFGVTRDHVLMTEVALVNPASAGPYCGVFFFFF